MKYGSTVNAICLTMRETQCFDATPILADALQDAGFDDEAVLLALRTPNLPAEAAQVLVALVYTDETREAVAWLERLAGQIGYEGDDPPTYSVESLVRIGSDGLESGQLHFWSDDGADYFRSDEQNCALFYQYWSLVTGKNATRLPTSFRCAC